MELTTDHVLKLGYDFSNEFEFGLSIILEGLTNPLTHDPTYAKPHTPKGDPRDLPDLQ